MITILRRAVTTGQACPVHVHLRRGTAVFQGAGASGGRHDIVGCETGKKKWLGVLIDDLGWGLTEPFVNGPFVFWAQDERGGVE